MFGFVYSLGHYLGVVSSNRFYWHTIRSLDQKMFLAHRVKTQGRSAKQCARCWIILMLALVYLIAAGFFLGDYVQVSIGVLEVQATTGPR